MPKVDVWFDTHAAQLPSLHGYLLYSALCAVQSELHQAPGVGLHTLHGERIGPGRIQPVRGARVGLRLPGALLALALPLVNRTLDIGGCPLRLGSFQVQPLQPAPSLSTRMVTIKNAVEEASFAEAVRRQLDVLGVQGTIEVGARKVQRIADASVVGFALRVHHLNEEQSLLLQSEGLGGRRRMGCGVLRASSVSAPDPA
jgi:CRISPR-associated protein Cas6